MPSLREAQLRQATYYQILAREANDLYSKGSKFVKEGLDLFDLEWDNIQTGQR